MAASPDSAVEKRVILVVDDEAALIDVLRSYFADEGFRVVEASDGQAAISKARETQPDLVLLDLNLPRLSGVEVLRALRAESNVPVIMLTSRIHEVDRIVGLELGADDYVTKPFSPREVVARVKAVLRRSGSNDRRPPSRRDLLRVGSIEIDCAAYEVRRHGSLVELTPTEFRILNTLAVHTGCALTREQILDRISADDDVNDRTLDRHIANLRHKIEDEPSRPRLVQTVVGVGYKLVDPKRVTSL